MTVHFDSAEFWGVVLTALGMLAGVAKYIRVMGRSDERHLRTENDIARAHAEIEALKREIRESIGDKFDDLKGQLSDLSREFAEMDGFVRARLGREQKR